MIEIGINPNTKIPSVAIRLNGYFGLGRDGIKLVDTDTVFQANTIRLAGVLPITAFDTLQSEKENNVEISSNGYTDPKTGKFAQGNLGGGRPKGSKNKSKTYLADRMKEVAETKHYKIKDTGEMVVAYDIMAETIVDKAVKGDMKAIEFFTERTEGKVTQGVKLSGALSHGTISDAELARLKEIFPD